MLNKEDILALAWEHSEGSGKRYTFTEESLFEFLKELKNETARAQDEREACGYMLLTGEICDQQEGHDGPCGPSEWLTRPAQTEQQPVYQKPNWENNYGYNKHVDMRCRDEANALVEHLEGLLDAIPEGPLYAAPIAQTAPQPEQSGLTWPVIELLSRYKRDLERRTFPDNEQGAFDLRWTAKEIERVSTTLSAQETNKI